MNDREKGPIYLTWRALRDAIATMPHGRLDDPVQVIPPGSHEDRIGLCGVYVIDTVASLLALDELGTAHQQSRSVLDNLHHPEHYVLLSDGPPFSPDGDAYYTLTDDGAIGNATGKRIDF